MASAGCTPEQIAAVVRAHEEARRAREAEIATIPAWKTQVEAVFNRDGYVCHYCGDENGPHEVDHLIPRSKGGTNALSNLVVACRSCNRSKKDKDADEFRSAGAARQARYRARKALQGVTERHRVTVQRNEVTGDVTTKEDPQTPKENITPLEPLRGSLPPKAQKQHPRAILLECLLPEIADAVIEHRQKKRAPLTALAAQELVKGFNSTADPNDAARTMVARGWQGFKLDWYERDKNNGQRNAPQRGSLAAAGERLLAKLDDHMRSEEGDGVRNSPVRLLPGIGGERP